jgi:hypothetical protein
MKQQRVALLSLVVAGAMVMAACGDDSKSTSTTAAADTTAAATATTAAAMTDTTAASGTTAAATPAADYNLKGVCPDKIVFGTDWFPEAEHAIYENLGAGYKVDKAKGSVSGPMVAHGGVDTGVQMEIRLGAGQGKNKSTVTADMYIDKDIFLGMISTDEQVAFSKSQPTVAVVAPQDKSPQILLWDPASHPGKTTIAEVVPEVDKVQYFSGGSYMDFFLATGVVPKAKADGSYGGGFDTFVANPAKTMQQGFATAEPYQLQNDVAQWKKPVAYQLVHDTGWQPYPEAWAMPADAFAKPETKACLKKLVPILQQGQIDIVKDPATAIKTIIDVNKTYDSFWKYDDGVAKYSIDTQLKLGIVGNGTGGSIGAFDTKRVDDFIVKALPIFKATGKDPKADVKASDLVTNEFIDTSIKL